MKPEQQEIDRLRVAKLKAERDILWCASCVARCSGRGSVLRPASCRVADAGEWSAGSASSPWSAEGHRRASDRVGQPPRPRIRPQHQIRNGSPTSPTSGPRRLRCRRRRPVLTARRRLGNEGRDDGPTRHRRPHHGDLEERLARQPAAPLRSGIAIYERAVPATDGRSRHHLLDEPVGRRSRPSEQPERSTGRGTTPGRMCSITSGASTTLGEGPLYFRTLR